MPSASQLGHRLANRLYKVAYPVYRPLYAAFKSYTDRFERAVLSRSLLLGNVVVDVGANIGIYSQFLARCVGPSGVVHCFEPDPMNFARLREAVSGWPNVRPNQIALSDNTGASLLYLSDKLNVDHRTYPSAEETRQTITIQTTTLDDYFKPGERVDFIKMDIQGSEVRALRGAHRVMTDNPKIMLLIEFWPYGLRQADASTEELLSYLDENGFSIFRLGKSGLLKFEHAGGNDDHPASYHNLFAQRAY